MSSWNAGEIADAIGSIIDAVCIDRYGNADTWTARLFTENRLIRSAIGLRRSSRLYVQRNLDKRSNALRGLEETVRVPRASCPNDRRSAHHSAAATKALKTNCYSGAYWRMRT